MAYKYKKVVKTHQWTKDEIKKLAKMWKEMTLDEIAEEFDVNKTQLSYITAEIRKAYPTLMTKKHRRGHLQSLIKEALG